MKVLELYAGTRSIGKAFEAAGHDVFSVDWDKSPQISGQITPARILSPHANQAPAATKQRQGRAKRALKACEEQKRGALSRRNYADI